MKNLLLLLLVCFLPVVVSAEPRKGIDNDSAVLAEIAKKGGYNSKGAKIKFRTDWSLFEGKAQRGIEATYPKKGKLQKIDEDTVEYKFDLQKAMWVYHDVTHGDTKLAGFTAPDVTELDKAAYDALNQIPDKIINPKIFKETVHVFGIRTVAKDNKPGKLEIIDENNIKYRAEIEILQKKGKGKCRVEAQIYWSNLNLAKKGNKWTVVDGEWEGKSIKVSKFSTQELAKDECGNLPSLGKTSLAEMYGEDKLPEWYKK